MVWSAEMPASHIAARFDDITRSAVSQHLGVLREAELVLERRDGTRRLYRANHAEMARLRTFLDGYWTESLQRLRDLAEATEQTSYEAQDTQESSQETTTRVQQEKGNTHG